MESRELQDKSTAPTLLGCNSIQGATSLQPVSRARCTSVVRSVRKSAPRYEIEFIKRVPFQLSQPEHQTRHETRVLTLAASAKQASNT